MTDNFIKSNNIVHKCQPKQIGKLKRLVIIHSLLSIIDMFSHFIVHNLRPLTNYVGLHKQVLLRENKEKSIEKKIHET